MKVDPNQPAMWKNYKEDGTMQILMGLPIKLEIAARFHAARLSNPNIPNNIPVQKRIEMSLTEAELFIIQFNNEQQEDEK